MALSPEQLLGRGAGSGERRRGPSRPAATRSAKHGPGTAPRRRRGAAAGAPGGDAGPAASQSAAGAASTGPDARGQRGQLSVRLRSRQERVSRRGMAGQESEEVPAVLLKRATQPRRGAYLPKHILHCDIL